MTWIDGIPIALLIVYGVLGFFTGVIRRLIGLVALYVGLVAATNMGLQAGSILQQSSSVATPDARIYGFFGILLAVLIVIDGAAQLAHSQIQLPGIVFNRVSGVAVGIITALLLSIVVTYELKAAANPFGGAQLDATQQSLRDAVNGSRVAVPVMNRINKPIISIFQPVLPADPQIYFSNGPVTS